MASQIRITGGGAIPATTVDSIQFTEFRLTMSATPPYRVSVSGKIRSYGEDGTDRIYEKEIVNVSIADLEDYIANLTPAPAQLIGEQALLDLYTGLGGIAEVAGGFNFDQVDSA